MLSSIELGESLVEAIQRCADNDGAQEGVQGVHVEGQRPGGDADGAADIIFNRPTADMDF